MVEKTKKIGFVRNLGDKLGEKNPSPVTRNYLGVVGDSTPITVTPYDGFYADVMVRVRRSSVATTYSLSDTNGSEIEDVDIVANGNGMLRTILQKSDKTFSFGVSPANAAAEYDLTVNITYHRIAGVI